MKTQPWGLGIIICLLSLPVMAELSPIEKQIRDDIVSRKQADIVLLEKWVNVNSGTSHLQGVHQVGEMLRPLFKQLGFKTQWLQEPSSMQRAGMLLATRVGHQGQHLLLIGHLDTVFPKESSFQHFQLNKNSAKGPGVLDDKGGLVVILSALQALNKVHALDNTTITVALTGDEEDSGKPTRISRQPLIAAAKHSDVALDFEPSVSLHTLSIARRGIGRWTITTHGNESHSATIFQKEVGVGAIFEISRILNTLRTSLMKVENLSFNPGLIIGGTKMKLDENTSQAIIFGKDNVVAKIASAQGDFRFISPMQKKEFESHLTEITKQSLPGTKSVVEFQDGIPAMPPTPANLALLKTYSEVSNDLGLGSVTPLAVGLRGAGDISHVASFVSACLVGLGPTGIGSHSVIETIELNSLPIQTQRAAILIYRLTRGNEVTHFH